MSAIQSDLVQTGADQRPGYRLAQPAKLSGKSFGWVLRPRAGVCLCILYGVLATSSFSKGVRCMDKGCGIGAGLSSEKIVIDWDLVNPHRYSHCTAGGGRAVGSEKNKPRAVM